MLPNDVPTEDPPEHRERIAGRGEEAVRLRSVIVDVVLNGLGNELGGFVPGNALPIVAAALLHVRLLQAPRCALHGILHAVEVVQALRMHEPPVADALVCRIRQVVVGAGVHHPAFADRGDDGAVSLAVAAAYAHHLVFVCSCTFRVAGRKGRHSGAAAHGGNAGHGSGRFEKASAGNPLDRGR